MLPGWILPTALGPRDAGAGSVTNSQSAAHCSCARLGAALAESAGSVERGRSRLDSPPFEFGLDRIAPYLEGRERKSEPADDGGARQPGTRLSSAACIFPRSDGRASRAGCAALRSRFATAIRSSRSDRRRRDYAREAVMIEGIIFDAMMRVATGFAICAVRT